MQFITIKTPTTVPALTEQVFDTQRAKPAVVKQAQAALRAANPHWGGRPKLPTGTLVLVPEVPGLAVTAEPSAAVVSGTAMERIKQVLAGAQAVAVKNFEAGTQEIEASVALAKSRELVVLAKEIPDVRTRLAQINEQSKAQLKQLEADQAEQLQGLAKLAKDLGSPFE